MQSHGTQCPIAGGADQDPGVEGALVDQDPGLEGALVDQGPGSGQVQVREKVAILL